METNHILLVEGNDDLHVIWALCNQHQIAENFNVINCNGIDNLIEQLPIRFKGSGIQTVGVVIDADDMLNRRWESVKAKLSSMDFDVPMNLPAEGLIISNNTQKAGVWIMPNNQVNGMLEDFITFLIPEHDKLLPIVDSTLKSIEAKGLNQYATCHRAKASIHTWLSWQKNPGTPLGASITKRYLTTDVVTCDKFIDWLRRLYS